MTWLAIPWSIIIGLQLSFYMLLWNAKLDIDSVWTHLKCTLCKLFSHRAFYRKTFSDNFHKRPKLFWGIWRFHIFGQSFPKVGFHLLLMKLHPNAKISNIPKIEWQKNWFCLKYFRSISSQIISFRKPVSVSTCPKKLHNFFF